MTRSSLAVVTGGAGFIGSNVALSLAERGYRVLVFDNFSRSGVSHNARWLRKMYKQSIVIQRGELADFHAVKNAVRDAGVVFHFAAQTAVTTSLEMPRDDFECNLLGTINLLEALRELPDPPPLLYTSTNKVYGRLADVPMQRNGSRYVPMDMELLNYGVSEAEPLDLRSPYGCSKGAADQYVLDYSRSFGIPAVVFRMSCIYGPRQFGTEEQGWVAHFLKQAVRDRPIIIYGDGLQVRDVLYVDDLVNGMMMAVEHIGRTRGRAFNIGGGPENTISLLELVDRIERLCGRRPKLDFEARRLGDQPYYVSDCRRFTDLTGWRPLVPPDEGVERLYTWILDQAEAEATAAQAREQKSEAFEGSKV